MRQLREAKHFAKHVASILKFFRIHPFDMFHRSYLLTYIVAHDNAFLYQFQILNNPSKIRYDNIRQPSLVVQETITEDSTFPEQAVHEIIIKDGTVTHIGGGQYNGYIQGSCQFEILYFFDHEYITSTICG